MVPALGKGVVAAALFSPAVATAFFWGERRWSTPSSSPAPLISNDQKYGPKGVLFALMSWLIPIGVVIILGAVAGLVWRERGLSVSHASDISRGDPIGSNDDNDCRWPSRLCSRCQPVCRRSGRTATTRFAVIPRPNGDSDALLSESGCRLAEGELAGQ